MADVSQLEINGTTYNICDATARDSLSQNYLPLTAGSNKPLTGDLNIKSTNIDRDGADPSSQQWSKAIKFIDKDNETIGKLSAIRETDGRIKMALYAYNENTSGSEQNNVFSMYIAKDGTQTYWVSSPAAFRNALGASSGIWPVSLGGTGATTAAGALANLGGTALATSSHSASSVSIASKGVLYLNLGGVAAKPGYLPVSAVVDVSSMSNYAGLIPSTIQSDGTYIWLRVFNNDSTASAGDISVTVYWLKS